MVLYKLLLSISVALFVALQALCLVLCGVWSAAVHSLGVQYQVFAYSITSKLDKGQ